MLEFRKNIHSQNGEDGIIEHLFDKLNITDNGTCCEFGSWDGKHLSNTFRLVKERNFKALYIEGDPEKYKDLLKTREEYTNIVPVCEYVNNNLDDIFERMNFPFDIDILSIDIDSSDYEVWKAIHKVNPKILIIEPDNTIPEWNNEPVYPVRPDGGANPTILKLLGKEKGYTFVCSTGNLFFVRNDLAHDIQPDHRIFPWWLEDKYKTLIALLSINIPNIEDYCCKLFDHNDAFTEYIKGNIEPIYYESLGTTLINYVKGGRLGYMSIS
jgi:hypothetical protein